MEEPKKITPMEGPEKELSAQEEEIRNLLRQVQSPGYRVTVWRTQPKWCESYLEDIDVDPGQNIDLQYLCHTWGGEKLYLQLKDEKGIIRGGKTLVLKSWKPRVLGEEIPRYGNFQIKTSVPGRNPKREEEDNPRFMQPPPPQQPPFDPARFMTDMMGVFVEMNKQMAKINKPAQNETLGSAPSNPMDQLAAGLKMYKELKKVFDASESVEKAAPDDFNSLIPMAGDVIKMLLQQKSVQPPQLPPQQSPPVSVVRNDVSQQQNTAPPPPAQNQATSNPPAAGGIHPDALPSLLAQLGADRLVEILGNTYMRLPAEDQQKLMGSLGGGLDGLDDLEFEEEEGTEEEEFEDGDDTDSAPVPHSNTGHHVRPDENDDSRDRQRDQASLSIFANQE